MFTQAYLEATEDEQQTARDGEREIIERTIQMMIESDLDANDGNKRVAAIHFTMQVWSYFLNDLASSENHTPDELKAAIISIGIFIIRHMESMRKDPELRFKPVREISETIREGLK